VNKLGRSPASGSQRLPVSRQSNPDRSIHGSLPRYLQGPCPNGSGDDIPRVDYVKRFAVITNPTEYAADFTKHLAASGQDNPLTLSDIKNYLVRTGREVGIDPHTIEVFDITKWLPLDRGLVSPGGLPARVLEQIPTRDTGNSMNYERN